MKMKELCILQVIGILLFAGMSTLMYYCEIFCLTSSIILYTVLAVGNVINAYNQLIKPIEALSIYDKLTGCYNRTRLDSKIKEYENYDRYAIIFFDVNNLKKANDVHGHDDGDKILVEASNQLRFWHRYGDLYRIGGDEFIVVVPNGKQSQLEKILPKWYSLLPALNREYDDDFVCSFSYGVFYKTEKDKKSFNDIMTFADEEMYKMKKVLKAQRKE